MNKKSCKKIKHHLTPNPLLKKEREKLLTSCASHTNSGEVKKPAFSLAEAMIMLVIVAILLALSAPLIAKRSSADARKLVLQDTGTNRAYNSDNDEVTDDSGTEIDFSRIFSAMAARQNFGIGTRTPNAKLHIQGGGNNADLLNVTPREITSGDASADTGLFVNSNGEVNIVACEPDWDNVTDTIPSPLTDGYLLLRGCASVSGNTICPQIMIDNINCSDSGCTIENYKSINSIVVPVNSGTTYTSNVDKIDSKSVTNDTDDRFIPCRQGYKAYHRG